jgi:hypothetical protein
LSRKEQIMWQFHLKLVSRETLISNSK